MKFDRTGNLVDIRTETARPNGKRNVSVAYTLTVPEEIDLGLRSVNGRIEVNDVSGAVDAKTTNGLLGIAGVTGPVEARAVSRQHSAGSER